MKAVFWFSKIVQSRYRYWLQVWNSFGAIFIFACKALWAVPVTVTDSLLTCLAFASIADLTSPDS